MARKVWVTDWEMQCCGEPFEVGSRVTWTTFEASTAAKQEFAELFGPEGAQVTDIEAHHGPLHDDQPTRAQTTGTVTAIKAVYWPRGLRHGESGYPVTGRATLEPRISADGWEPEEEAGPSFHGYIVDLASS